MLLFLSGQMNEINERADKVHQELLPKFFEMGKVVEHNQAKVLNAFKKAGVSDFHFQASTGYGYDDAGRETLEKVYADVFNAEAAIVRNQIVSGTHAISTALFGILRPGDELLYVTGRPYDTLEEVIGIRGKKNAGSLNEFGITYREVPLSEGKIDIKKILSTIKPHTKIIGMQRSCGYGDRPSIGIEELREAISSIKKVYPQIVIFVDNCYGEFVETLEPTDAGADLVAGSLIKNPGGGIAKSGGYIVGRKKLIEQCGNRLTAPGIGLEGGASLGTLLDMFQGFFLAPHVVGESLKGAVFSSALLSSFGMTTSPGPDEQRTDLIQSVSFPNREAMILFCQEIQAHSPVDAHVKPYPSAMPGYESEVIMAAGAFIQGASIELSADGPLREPYKAYVQGGLTFEHIKIAVTASLVSLYEKEILTV
ncbi:aminotransferase class I/II-fold pyridoxal phosphate-dependent enzyme [Alkalicoccus daliensis]|uniref:Cystathionine beta-lyase family protein involved in aluminum resistance n=1 Tax=Alkalicoccus daliensis TaxID=745820 RepID=A0A1H0AD05_9BACI|nr:methionine gamma-lyase family protein [Alkalicoccus daliensis]SDN30606.1 Cystathionine beta-lyase family protein involved in aluminum resistance [Alkalicoccus daliensis]